MTKEIKQNYTEAQTLNLIQRYQAGDSVEVLSTTLGKTTRSVVAKLSREGVYKPKTTQKQNRVKKSELVDELAEKCNVAAELFESLEKANYDVLEVLVSRLR